MLNYVNGKIPNNLKHLLSERKITISDAVRISGLTRPTVQRLVDGDDSYLGKMAQFCDSLGLSMSEIYGSGSFHQENHAHDNSRPTMIGYQFNQSEIEHLKQRVFDLEAQLDVSKKLIQALESKSSD